MHYLGFNVSDVCLQLLPVYAAFISIIILF